MGRHRRPIRITPIPIRATIQEWGWRGARLDLRWAPGPVAPGAIATGTAGAMSLSITKITSTGTLTETLIETSIVARQAKAIAGSTIPNTAAMRPMETEEPPTSSADVAPVAPVVRAASEDLVVQVA
jgi:hypothetical protein